MVLDWGIGQVLLDGSKSLCKKSSDVWSLTLKIKEQRKFRCSEGSLLFLEDECFAILRKYGKGLPSDTASQTTWLFSSIKRTACFITRFEAWAGFSLSRKTWYIRLPSLCKYVMILTGRAVRGRVVVRTYLHSAEQDLSSLLWNAWVRSLCSTARHWPTFYHKWIDSAHVSLN